VFAVAVAILGFLSGTTEYQHFYQAALVGVVLIAVGGLPIVWSIRYSEKRDAIERENRLIRANRALHEKLDDYHGKELHNIVERATTLSIDLKSYTYASKERGEPWNPVDLFMFRDSVLDVVTAFNAHGISDTDLNVALGIGLLDLHGFAEGVDRLLQTAKDRMGATAGIASHLKSLPQPSAPVAPGTASLKGRIERFEPLDFSDLSATELAEWEEEWKRPFTVGEVLAYGGDRRFYYKAWLRTEALGGASKASQWEYGVKHKGDWLRCLPVLRQWDAPKTWPKIDFNTLDQVQNMYLQPGVLYNVYMYICCPVAEQELEYKPFEIRFTDDRGLLITCGMA
jgi:hypothetical protein